MGNSASIARENELHRENEALRHELRREKEESRRQQRVPLPLTEELRSSREQMLMQTDEELQRQVQAILVAFLRRPHEMARRWPRRQWPRRQPARRKQRGWRRRP